MVAARGFSRWRHAAGGRRGRPDGIPRTALVRCRCSAGHPAVWATLLLRAPRGLPTAKELFTPTDTTWSLANSDGSEPHKLFSAPNETLEPVWSPDGSVIRFRVGGSITTRGSLWQVSVNGTDPHPAAPCLAHSSQRMLRPVDSRRKIFCFPVRRQYLGSRGKGKLVRKRLIANRSS